jgi:preprotein translocase subunit SecG
VLLPPLLVVVVVVVVVVLLLLQHSRSWWKGAPATCSGSAVAAPALATAAPRVPLAVLWRFCRFEGALRKR